jgi:hypothetical protein
VYPHPHFFASSVCGQTELCLVPGALGFSLPILKRCGETSVEGRDGERLIHGLSVKGSLGVG